MTRGRYTRIVDGKPFAHMGGRLEDMQANFPDDEFVEGTLPIEVEIDSWDDIRRRRNSLLNDYAWTVMPGSPLANVVEWLNWRDTLNRLTLDFGEAEDVVWPPLPEYIYA